ncbi:MAG: hypothetical protein GMKNLPBB_01374 [Myxococcota bacterium]|nr:hypothetical protein [Myxococcota bacterium]
MAPGAGGDAALDRLPPWLSAGPLRRAESALLRLFWRHGPVFRQKMLVASLAAAIGVAWCSMDASEPVGLPGEPISAYLQRSLGWTIHQWAAPGLDNPLNQPHRTLLQSFVSHPVLFTASGAPGQPAELYLGQLQLTREGQPSRLESAVNLSRSRDSHEENIQVQGNVVVYQSRVREGVESVTVLNFDGEPDSVTRHLGWVGRLASRLSNLLELGSSKGVERTTFALDEAADGVRVQASGGRLLLEIAGDAAPTRWEYDLVERRHLAGPADQVSVRQWKREFPGVVIWMLNTVRNLSWVGSRKIEYIEEKFYSLQDSVQRIASRPADPPPEEPEFVLKPHAATAGSAAWPAPASLTPMVTTPAPGEGVWQEEDFYPSRPGAPPLAWTTTVRTDSARPHQFVKMIRFDGRRVRLHAVAGTEEPVSTTGIPGSGRIPKEVLDSGKLVAGFTGGFLSLHGGYGMKVDGRMVAPPSPGIATVGMDANGHASMFTWRKGFTAPAEMRSFRQNLYPLIENGRINEAETRSWGITGPGRDPVFTSRSAIAVTGSGDLIFAWGSFSSAISLARALKASGAVYAVHLDMNINHINMEMYRTMEGDGYEAKPFAETMRKPEFPAFLKTRSRDFFYLAEAPAGLDSLAPGGDAPATAPAWSQPLARPGVYPPPALFAADPGKGWSALLTDSRALPLALGASGVCAKPHLVAAFIKPEKPPKRAGAPAEINISRDGLTVAAGNSGGVTGWLWPDKAPAPKSKGRWLFVSPVEGLGTLFLLLPSGAAPSTVNLELMGRRPSQWVLLGEAEALATASISRQTPWTDLLTGGGLERLKIDPAAVLIKGCLSTHTSWFNALNPADNLGQAAVQP